MTNADIVVPTIANANIDPMFWKKFPLCKLYPDSNMIGGRSTRKNAVGENTSSRFEFAIYLSDSKLMSSPISAPKHTTTMLSGKYWNPVSSIVWMSSMPKAITHSTKNMAIELLCSASTAFDSVLVIGFGVDVAVPFFIASAAVDRFWAGVTGTGDVLGAGVVAFAILTLCVSVRFVLFVVFTSHSTALINHKTVHEQLNTMKSVLMHFDFLKLYVPII